jgi:glycosyltransferase involved in cell wall biosynthesis
VTFIVKAFERRLCLARLLDSTAAVYPNVPVIVLDDSSAPLLNTSELSAATQRLPYLRYILSPFDVGLAAGRNALVDEVTTPFVLLLDDDFILEAGSGIERLQDVLERGVFDLAGGCIDSAHGYSLLRSNAQLEVRADIACVGQADRPPVWQTPDLSCWQVDMINNFFLARTDFLRQVRWDPRLK